MFPARSQAWRSFEWRLIVVSTVAAVVFAPFAIRAAGPARRARPPKFTKNIEDAFFPDARERLSGPRPAAAAPSRTTPGTTAGETATPSAAAQTKGWSKWISAEVLEDEIKAQQVKLAETVLNPSKFKGGDFEKARAHLSVLAVMFAIAAEYDGKVRWQREAAALRDLVARAGFNCKVGTDASYKEAKTRADDLQILVRGGSIELPKAAAELGWSKVADRQPLMRRLEQAQQQTVDPLTSSSSEFERHADRLAQEAQRIAALAEVVAQEGYEFADDEAYLEHAKAMQAHAQAVRDAAQRKNYDEARKAAGELSKTCTNCHEGFRS